MSPSRPPVSYAEWSAWFDALEAGSSDTDLLEWAAAGRMNWSAGVAELLGERMMSAMDSRLNAIGRSFEARLRSVRGETELLSALINARLEFGRLRRFAALDCVPGPLRDSINALIGHHLEARQRALEKSAAEDRTGRLSYLIGRNRLDSSAPASPDEPIAQSGGSAPRRILISRGPP